MLFLNKCNSFFVTVRRRHFLMTDGATVVVWRILMRISWYNFTISKTSRKPRWPRSRWRMGVFFIVASKPFRRPASKVIRSCHRPSYIYSMTYQTQSLTEEKKGLDISPLVALPLHGEILHESRLACHEWQILLNPFFSWVKDWHSYIAHKILNFNCPHVGNW